jgi:hypothetical protein
MHIRGIRMVKIKLTKKQENRKKKKQKHASDPISLSVVFESSAPSQCLYEFTKFANNTIVEQPESDINLFFLELGRNRYSINVPMLPVHKLAYSTNPVICTSIKTYKAIQKFDLSHKYFYIWFPEWINRRYVVSIDDDTTIFTRHNDYLQLIKDEFGVEAHQTIVENWNLKHLKEVING